MRILITTDLVGGVWDYAGTLTRELAAAGHEVRLAVLGDADPLRLGSLPPGVRWSAAPFRLEWMPGGPEDVAKASDWLRDVAADARADVVHLNQFAYAAGDLGRPVLVVAHSDVVSWFREVRGEAPPADLDSYRRVVERGLAAADVVVAPTVYQSVLLQQHYGRTADLVIPNGAARPPARFSPGREPPLVVLAARAWDEGKGAPVLDAALKRMGDAAPEAHLLGPVVGPDGQRYRPSRLIVHGRQRRESVDRWFDAASIYVAPSLYEPFGLAPLEAARRGCALLLSDIASFRELWDGCAEFFTAGDADALADALTALVADAGRRRELGRLAFRRALERFTAARMAAAYVGVYRDLAGLAGREVACA